ncbi:hypothetical protein ACHAWF_010978 [Thalassiosira exigua]
MGRKKGAHRRSSTEKSGDKKRRCRETRAPDPIHSSWFQEVKWVSQYDQLSEKSEVTSPISTSTSSKGDAKEPNVVTQTSHDDTEVSLISELNTLKNQFMPSAEACADAINRCHGVNTTTADYQFRQARSICNPYECLGKTLSKEKPRNRKFSKFVNRSAIKLSNIDALLGFTLTLSHQQEHHPFIFVDLCGAPGGFSEYILYRHAHPARILSSEGRHGSVRPGTPGCRSSPNKPCYGFGMSLSGSNDDGKGVPWDLDHLKQYHLCSKGGTSTGERNLFWHMCIGADSTGSIYNWDNVIHLQRQINANVSQRKDDDDSHGPLANLVVADGGFDAQRDSNNQEAIAHKIVVSQTAAALALLRPGGIFVLKMFGFREHCTRRMLHYLYGRFDKLRFVKPILSRPASAERYLVCHGYVGPELGWDGFLWREEMADVTERPSKSIAASLDELMDSFDLDMLRLNIDTCQSILNHLNMVKEAVEQGSVYQRQKQQIVPKRFEIAWQLL